MPSFKAIIQKFAGKGEKTGWTYVNIPKDILTKLKRKDKKPFRIKGVIDDVKFEKLSTYAIGEGEIIIAINGALRKKLGKKEGAQVLVNFELDKSEAPRSKELLACLKEDKVAEKKFFEQPLSHQNYFHRYIIEAKTDATKAGRITNTLNAMHKGQNFGEMIRSLKKK